MNYYAASQLHNSTTIRNPQIYFVNRYFLMFGGFQIRASYPASRNDVRVLKPWYQSANVPLAPSRYAGQKKSSQKNTPAVVHPFMNSVHSHLYRYEIVFLFRYETNQQTRHWCSLDM